jgi:exoribonuclease-2
MYVELTPELDIVGNRSVVEQVRIVANLRHDTLERDFNEESLAANRTDYRFGPELTLLWKLAGRLEQARGKKEEIPGTGRADYNFYVEDDRVRITERRRGSPIDRVVSELMILVNAEWGRQLAESGTPALYRVQGNGKVKMSTVPAGHQGLGVAQYVWASSPLRRYADLVNQRQLIAMLAGEAPPYPPKDERLLVILRDFELAYDAYAEFQRSMERYWCLRWLLQEEVQLTAAAVLRDELVRLDRLPLVLRATAMPALPPGTPVELAVSDIDLLEIDARAEFKRQIEPAA